MRLGIKDELIKEDEKESSQNSEKKWRDKLVLAEFKTTLATARNRADTMENRDMWDRKRIKKELDGRHKKQDY